MSTILPADPPTRDPFEIHNTPVDFPGGEAIHCNDPASE
jgi:hypothetical protein